ncbi:MAG: XdhC family protein [Elusimicrobia bacterium]|nr:XdhC family protein [Elusimicrobiota bacterium]
MTHSELMTVLSRRLAGGQSTALVTLTRSTGSAPRELGAKMLVFPDGTIQGTIGGGRLEAQAIEDAIKAIKGGQPLSRSYELEPKALGMYCGGTVEVFIDVFTESLKLVILGGGHVGEKLAALAAFLGVPHWVIDDRPEFAAPARFPHARQTFVAQPSAALQTLHLDENTAIAIVTRCHGFDLRCLVAALPTKAFYIGMIGSRTKTRRLFDACERRELNTSEDGRVHAPIGLDLGGRTPEAIALSIMAEIMRLRNGATGEPLSLLREAKA